jgi:hypothetical protein
MNNELPKWLSLVREKVESLRYGMVQIVIHDSRVTQIERTEKTRLEGREEAEAVRGPRSRESDRPDTLEDL